MRKLIIASILIMACLFFTYFIFSAWTDAFYNEDKGLVNKLDEQAQKSMSGQNLDNWNNKIDDKQFLFNATVGVVLITIFLLLIIYAIKRDRGTQQ